MADQITDNRTLLFNGGDGTGGVPDGLAGTAFGSLDNEFFFEGANSYTEYFDNTRRGMLYDAGSAQDWTGNTFYLVCATTIVGFLVAKASGGITIRFCGATVTDWFEVYVAGNDVFPVAIDGGWVNFVVDIEEARRVAVANGWTNGTVPATSAIRYVGPTVLCSSMPRMVDNFWLDTIHRLPPDTPGIIVEGRNGGSTDWDSSDILTELGGEQMAFFLGAAGSYVVSTPVQFGIADATTMAFTDSATVWLWEGQEFIGANLYGLTTLEDTGTTTVTFNNSFMAGDVSVDGVPALRPGDLVTGFNWTSSTLLGWRRILLDSSTTITGVLEACGQIDPMNVDYSGNMDLDGASLEYVYSAENFTVNSGNGGDFEFIGYVLFNDWTPTTYQCILCHGTGATPATQQFCVVIRTPSGRLGLDVSDAGNITALVATSNPFTDGQAGWVRVTYDQSAGQASFYYSFDPVDTPPGDVNWTANGTPSGVVRNMDNAASEPFYIGSEAGGGSNWLDGQVMYVEFWDNGFSGHGGGGGDLRFRADWRTGPDFTSGTRTDDFESGLTWTEAGTSPTYTQGDDNSTPADLAGLTVSNSTSVAALFWNVNDTTPTELDGMTFASSGTGHAIELGPSCATTITLDGWEVTGYAGTDGTTGNEVIYNNSGKSITVNITNGTGTFTVRNGTGSSTTVVVSPVTALVNVKDENGDNLVNARVYLKANGDGADPLPTAETVTSISRSGTLATVTHTAHGMETGDKISIKGITDKTEDNNGVQTITYIDANSYSYVTTNSGSTSYTGTITVTWVAIEALTDASGNASRVKSYSADQPVSGWVRMSTASTRYKSFPISGTISSADGLTINVQMIPDE